MAFVEGAEALAAGGLARDFNDSIVGNIAGHIGGNLVQHAAHDVGSAIGTGGEPEERVNIGPMGHLA
jgi:hypothetical protein